MSKSKEACAVIGGSWLAAGLSLIHIGLGIALTGVLLLWYAFSKDKKTTILKGYVARDKDGSLWFHYVKPRRMNDIENTWWGSNDKAFQIYDFDLPEFKDLTWECEPVEVEFKLTRL